MPIYEYTCKACEKRFEHLHRSMAKTAKVQCPSCGSTKTERGLSLFAVATEGPKQANNPPPGTCGRCGGPGPCGM
jgi:putative FmdB family regulatory protein